MLPVLHSSLFFVAVDFYVVFSGCTRSVPLSDADEKRRPYYQKAKNV
jgi:hypothetical protein